MKRIVGLLRRIVPVCSSRAIIDRLPPVVAQLRTRGSLHAPAREEAGGSPGDPHPFSKTAFLPPNPDLLMVQSPVGVMLP